MTHARAMRRPTAWLLCTLIGACVVPAARAADAPAPLAIQGQVDHPATLGADALRSLPPVSVEIDDPEHAPTHRRYTGALLWTLVAQAAPRDEPGRKTRLRHTLLATGRDGYAVALSLAEIDPAFEGKQVIVAYSLDGAALDGLRLVVPGDRKAGRSVRDLVRVDVR